MNKIFLLVIGCLLTFPAFALDTPRYSSSCDKTADCTMVTVHNNTGHVLAGAAIPWMMGGQWKDNAFLKPAKGIPVGNTTDILYSDTQMGTQMGISTLLLGVLSDHPCTAISWMVGVSGYPIFAIAEGDNCTVTSTKKNDGFYVDITVNPQIDKKITLPNPNSG